MPLCSGSLFTMLYCCTGAARRQPLEDAGFGGSGGHRGVLHALRVRADALIVAEEEDLIALDGAAERTAVVILDQHRDRHAGGVVEEIVGVEIAVAQVIEQIAVILVRAGPRVTNWTCAPALRPYSALPPSVTMRASSTESVLFAVSERPMRGVTESLTSMPSSVLLLLPWRSPLTWAKL